MAEFSGSPASSALYALQNGDYPSAGQVQGPVYVARFSYTHSAGAGTGQINLGKLPAGRVVVHPQISSFRTSQFAASATLDLGHRAYKNFDGTVVPEDDDEWLSALDVNGGATNDFLSDLDSNAVEEATEYETIDGLVVFVTVEAGNIEDGDTIDCELFYSLVA